MGMGARRRDVVVVVVVVIVMVMVMYGGVVYGGTGCCVVVWMWAARHSETAPRCLPRANVCSDVYRKRNERVIYLCALIFINRFLLFFKPYTAYLCFECLRGYKRINAIVEFSSNYGLPSRSSPPGCKW